MTDLSDALDGWPGRFRHPTLLRQLYAAEPGAAVDLGDAVLDGIVADLEEAGALAALVLDGEFAVAERMLDECALDEQQVTSARTAITAGQARAVATTGGELRRLADRAKAAGLPFARPADIDASANRSRAEADRVVGDLTTDLEQRIDAVATGLRQRLDGVEMLDAERRTLTQLLDQGQLRTAASVLDQRAHDHPGPEIHPPMIAWRWSEPPAELLRWHLNPNLDRPPSFAEWDPVDESAEEMLRAFDELAVGGEGPARSFALALERFLGTPAEVADEPLEIHAIDGGYLTSVRGVFADALIERFHPAARVPLYIGEAGSTSVPGLAGVDPFLAVGPGTDLDPPPGRGRCARLGVADLLRLATVRAHRGISLARILGRQWSPTALGAGAPTDLDRLLGTDPAARWQSLCWLADLAGLGGTLVAPAPDEQAATEPSVLHVLLAHLADASWIRTAPGRQAAVTRWLDDGQLAARVEAATFGATGLSRTALVTFWAALLTDDPGQVLSHNAVILTAALVRDRLDWEPIVRSGFEGLAGNWFVERLDGDELVLRHCGVLVGLRTVAEKRLQHVADEILEGRCQAELGPTAWGTHRFALSPAWPAYRDARRSGEPEETLSRLRLDLMAPIEELSGGADLTGQADLNAVIADLEKAATAQHPGLTVVLDLGVESAVRVNARVATFLLFELFENAIEAMAGSGTISVSTRVAEPDIVIDVRDTGPGLPDDGGGDFRIFRRGFSTNGPGRGHGLFVGRRLAQRADGDLELESPRNGHPVYRGAHLKLFLPRA